ncbi:MAG TPA: hypothetical protein VJH23_06030 [archaeon]|nr:hypothetical protein [archaeon]
MQIVGGNWAENHKALEEAARKHLEAAHKSGAQYIVPARALAKIKSGNLNVGKVGLERLVEVLRAQSKELGLSIPILTTRTQLTNFLTGQRRKLGTRDFTVLQRTNKRRPPY